MNERKKGFGREISLPKVASYSLKLQRKCGKEKDKKFCTDETYLQARVSPEEKLAIAEHVNTTNESLSDFIRRAITETMERDKVSTVAKPK